MNLVDRLFQRLKSENRKAFIPFVTAGDPDLAATRKLVPELVRHGASLIEIGFPYSDPIADGSVIQASYTRALEKHLRVDDIFAMTQELSRDADIRAKETPLVAMVSYTLVHRRSPEQFILKAKASGLSGAIVPDLPFEEATGLAELARIHDFKLIHLVTPTSSQDRARRIAQSSSGFLYVVSVAGITGERDALPPELLQQLSWLRTQTDLPLCVGFGVSKPSHVEMLRPAVDGVIVGSAIVRKLEQANDQPIETVIEEIGNYVESLVTSLNP